MRNLIYNILKKSQKFTGTDNVYIAKHGLYLTIGNIIGLAAAFLLSIAFARLLPQEIYGQYRYILSIMAILAISSLQGIDVAIIRGVALGFENTIKKGFKTKLKWSLLGSIGSIGFAIYFWFQGNIEFTISFLIVAAFLPLFKSGEIYQSYLSGKKLFDKKVTYSTLIQILSTASLILVLFLTKNLIILILTYFLSYSILRIAFFFWIIRKIKPNQKSDSETISYGKHLSVIWIISLISQQIDKILLFHFVGPIQLAIYSFANLPIQHLRTPLQTIQELARPKLATRSEKEIKKTLPKKLLKSTFFILIGIALYIIIAPYFYKILYPQYLESITYSIVLSFGLLIFPASMMQIALMVKMKVRSLYKLNVILPITKIVLLALLTFFYGIWGVVIATLLSYFLQSCLAYFFFKKM